MDIITQILENVVRCQYFEAGVHIKNPIKNSYQDGLGRTTQTLDHVVVVHMLIWDKRKSQINEYSDNVEVLATQCDLFTTKVWCHWSALNYRKHMTLNILFNVKCIVYVHIESFFRIHTVQFFVFLRSSWDDPLIRLQFSNWNTYPFGPAHGRHMRTNCKADGS